MAASSDPHYYYLRFRTEACWHIVSINDVPLSIKPAAERQEWTVPINTLVQQGGNDLSFNFVPVWGEAYPAGAPNPQFAVRMDLVRYNLTTQTDEEYTALHMVFDMETGTLVPVERSELGASRGEGTASFGRSGQLSIEDGEYRDIYGPPVPSRVLRVSFDVPDDLPLLTWADAPVLDQPTGHLRTELVEAYTAVHGALASASADQIKAAYGPAWSRTAQVMHYESVDEFVEVNDALTELAPTLDDGAVLQPPLFWPSPAEAGVFYGANNRLAFIVPSPLRWADPETPDRTASQTAVAFMRDPASGRLVVASVLFLV